MTIPRGVGWGTVEPPDRPESQTCHWCQRSRRYGRWASLPMDYGRHRDTVWVCTRCDQEGDVE